MAGPRSALNNGKPGGVYRCKVSYNPKTNGYAVVGEVFLPTGHVDCALAYISSSGITVKTRNLSIVASTLRPHVVYDERSDCLVIISQTDNSICSYKPLGCNPPNTTDFIVYRKQSALPNESLPGGEGTHLHIIGRTTLRESHLTTLYQPAEGGQCIGTCYDVQTYGGLSTAVRCITHCSEQRQLGWNQTHHPSFCLCGHPSTSSATVSYRNDKISFAAVWEEQAHGVRRLNGHFMNPTLFSQGSKWTDQRSPTIVHNPTSDSVCVFWKYSSGCSTCYKSAVRCFTPSTKCTDPCCCSELPTCGKRRLAAWTLQSSGLCR